MSLSRNLRQDLDLLEASPYEDGSPRWRLYDPVANRFYDIGWLEVEILRELRSNPDPALDSTMLAKIIADRASVMCNSQQIEDYLEFLETNNLMWPEGERALEQRKALRKSQASKWVQNTLKQYLFLRMPLLHPDRLLDAMLPYVNWAFNPLTWWLLLANTVLAVYLTSRQADHFFDTFVNYFTPMGLVYFSLAIIVAKILHEFGHALAARKFGASTRAMGVALLMFWPILYTDTTDTWRLQSRRQRVLVGLAGIMVELAIASVCLLLWNFFPEGFLRTILFMLATTTWIATLAINLNPLMRFDGYYVLSDFSGVENLQERSNAMGRWFLRELLFGFGVPAPELGRRWLIPFAYAVWIYRCLVFFGICYLVYTFFFKMLGIVLALAQVIRLLVMPIGRELLAWWSLRESADRTRTGRTSIALTLAVILFVLPVDNELELPAYWQAGQVVTLYAPIAGQLELLPAAGQQQVAAGDEVVVIASPDLQFELDQARHDVAASRYELQRTSVNVGLAQDRLALQARLSGALEKKADTTLLLQDARLKAPFAATVTDLQPDMRAGDWISKGDKLVTLVDARAGEIVAYLEESELDSVAPGALGRFYPSGGTRAPITVKLEQIEGFALEKLEQPYVASLYQGGLDVRDGKDGAILPQRATYRLHLSTTEPVRDRVLAGQLVLKSESRSLVRAAWRQIVGTWRRESGL